MRLAGWLVVLAGCGGSTSALLADRDGGHDASAPGDASQADDFGGAREGGADAPAQDGAGGDDAASSLDAPLDSPGDSPADSSETGPVCWNWNDAGVLSCDDGVACTRDSCGGDGGCQHVPNDTLCPSGETCSATLGCQCHGCFSGSSCVSGQSDQACGVPGDAGAVACVNCATTGQACLNGACM